MRKYERFVQVLEDRGYKRDYFANRCIFYKSKDSIYDIAEHCGDFFMVVNGEFNYEKKIETEEQLVKYCDVTGEINDAARKIVEMGKELHNIFK